MENNSQKSSSRGEKTICLPIANEEKYQLIIDDSEKFRAYLENIITEHPEIFPSEIEKGFSLFGCTRSKKQNLKIRRIQLKANYQIYQLRPSFIMPYMVGKTSDFDKPLYLRRYGVPFDALTYVFGKNDMYWYRALLALGRFSVVGTTVKQKTMMPKHLLADEKHSRWKGQKVYLPSVAANGCLLGIDIVENADSDSLIKGYSTFANEARNLDPNYSPDSVNLDGWEATRNAWKKLFPKISIILCFLHIVLGIKDYIRRDKSLLKTIKDKLWFIYHGESKRQFAQRLRRFWEWSTQQIFPEKVHSKIEKAKANSHQFQQAYNYEHCYRTSNQIDRLMNYQDRILDQMQYFHGSINSARLFLRAIALIWNFHPLGKRACAQTEYHERYFPFEKINHFCYSHNWLENLLIAGSLNGYRLAT
jgi:hypothetical protein